MILTPIEVIAVLFALCTKHLVCDFFLQFRYQFENKGTYGHPGGILHAAITAAGTLGALVGILGYYPVLLFISLLDGVIHYHIDWAKMSINKRYNFTPTTDSMFWWLLGIDQYFHYLTYLFITILIIGIK